MHDVEFLLSDPEYRWNDDLTDDMHEQSLYNYLHSEATRMEGQEEWDCAYGIYRELVWRFPRSRTSWIGLQRAAQVMRHDREVQAAAQMLETLAQQ